MNVIPSFAPSAPPPGPDPAGPGGGLLAPGTLSRGAAAAAAAGISAAADVLRTVLEGDASLFGADRGRATRSGGWTVAPESSPLGSTLGYAGSPASDAGSAGGAAAPRQKVLASTFRTTVPAASTSSKASASSKSASHASSSSKSKSHSTSSSSSSRGEYAFLDDRRVSVEEKLFQFMKITQKKGDDELVRLMKNYRELHGSSARSSASASGSGSGSTAPAKKSDGGGGLFGFLGDVAGVVGDAVGVVGGAAGKLASEAGGPLLAAAATALGQPELAPVALSLGGEIGKVAGGILSEAAGAVSGARSSSGSSSGSKSSSSSTSSSSSSSSASGDAGSPDEKLDMLEIQRAVEKQNQMFTLISNILKSQHDTGMAEINNVR